MTGRMLALLLAAAPWLPAQAGPSPVDAAVAACRDDVRKLCSAERPGGGRVAACLQRNEAELAPACKAQLPQLVRCSEQVRQVCGDGRPRELRGCLQKNRDRLDACPAAPAGA